MMAFLWTDFSPWVGAAGVRVFWRFGRYFLLLDPFFSPLPRFLGLLAAFRFKPQAQIRVFSGVGFSPTLFFFLYECFSRILNRPLFP